MTETIGPLELERMLQRAAMRLKEQNVALSALDSVIGDGDHGTTMLRIADQFIAVSVNQHGNPQSIFRDAGWRILGVDGGASSSILGTFFLGMADAQASSQPLNCQALAAAFEAGLAAISKHTLAKPGDKTLMDALTPAITTLRLAADSGKDVSDAFREAACAARAGAKSTAGLTARFGRAKFLGEKTRGHQDPGATSVALLFEGFSTALFEMKGEVNA